MHRKIMVPVDLEHLEQLDRALEEARALAALHEAELVYVGVTAPTPSPVAHTPAEYAARLETFATEEGVRAGRPASAYPIVSHDPAADLDAKLLEAIAAVNADLVVMASHRPGWREHMFSSNAGYIASHAPVSVMVVR